MMVQWTSSLTASKWGRNVCMTIWYDLRACPVVTLMKPVLVHNNIQNSVSALCSVYCHRWTNCQEREHLHKIIRSRMKEKFKKPQNWLKQKWKYAFPSLLTASRRLIVWTQKIVWTNNNFTVFYPGAERNEIEGWAVISIFPWQSVLLLCSVASNSQL